ncbi:MAG: glutamine--fructose-6-phosphate transaminase (isomerizing) [Firmicutes bacterium]|nr:glutamine--fructose-6-phosphate transaminase (isomerizing) [Bacillota bacterium]
MCGIIGITGAQSVASQLLEALSLLEYRGYDSAGIAVVEKESGSIFRLRAAEQGGSLHHLIGSLGKADTSRFEYCAGIGHTRWATHGAPTTVNAHPHFDCGSSIAVVHNGIIENHHQLASDLRARGHVFSSETDTEVIAHLLEEETADGRTMKDAVVSLLTTLRGAFALACIHKDFPETIYAARRTSPLVIGMADSSCLLASDVAALVETTRNLFELGDDQVAEVTPIGFKVYDQLGVEMTPKPIKVGWSIEAARKGGFADYMSKEINEQQVAVAETILGRLNESGDSELEELEIDEASLSKVEKVLLVACGSSYHAALVGRHAIEAWAKIPAEVDIASEMRYRPMRIQENTLVIAISQSGETTDTYHALKQARSQGVLTIAMTNVVGSLMSREADGVLYTRAGPEIGVASTKCHLAQLSLLECLAFHLAGAKSALSGSEKAAIAGDIMNLPKLVEKTLARQDQYHKVAERYSEFRDFYYLGRRSGFPIALEGALKLKELAYVRAEAYPAGEMKHGPISLIEPGSIVVVVAKRSSLWEKIMANVEEMKARGATVIAVIDEDDEESASLVDDVLETPAVTEICSPVIGVIPLQIFAYSIAKARGHDVDRPRNLAKVVTVE